jgi:hypothetical protein
MHHPPDALAEGNAGSSSCFGRRFVTSMSSTGTISAFRTSMTHTRARVQARTRTRTLTRSRSHAHTTCARAHERIRASTHARTPTPTPARTHAHVSAHTHLHPRTHTHARTHALRYARMHYALSHIVACHAAAIALLQAVSIARRPAASLDCATRWLVMWGLTKGPFQRTPQTRDGRAICNNNSGSIRGR